MNFNKEVFDEWLSSDLDIPFDLYSRDPSKFPLLQKVFPGMIVFSVDYTGKLQVEGLLEEHPFFYIDRDGWVSLNVGEKDGMRPYINNSLWSAGTRTEQGHEVVSFVQNLLTLTTKLSKSEFLYSFEGKLLETDSTWSTYTDTGMTKIYTSLGRTSEEAYKRLHSPLFGLENAGIAVDNQMKIFAAREINPKPLFEDKRVYPAEPLRIRINTEFSKDLRSEP